MSDFNKAVTDTHTAGRATAKTRTLHRLPGRLATRSSVVRILSLNVDFDISTSQSRQGCGKLPETHPTEKQAPEHGIYRVQWI